MNSRTKYFIPLGLSILGLIIFIFTPETVLSATGIEHSARSSGLSIFDADIPTIIGRAIAGLLAIAGVLFLLLIIYAGFTYMTARGNEQQITKAKDTMIRALIGLIIVFSSYTITSFVFRNLFSSLIPGAGQEGEVIDTGDDLESGLNPLDDTDFDEWVNSDSDADLDDLINSLDGI